MDEPGVVAAFWVLAVTAVGSALMVAAVRNLLHAVLFLVLSFVGVAGLYLTLSADFVAVVQVLIYAGAIAVLVLFAIMLTPRAARDNAEGVFWVPALVLAGLVATTISLIATRTEWAVSDRGAFSQTATDIGEALLDPFVLPFEVASALLVVAMIGAILIVREEEE
jgi:NADH:ubiquinone oxidoreductase subunit 6 (subunit J)